MRILAAAQDVAHPAVLLASLDEAVLEVEGDRHRKEVQISNKSVDVPEEEIAAASFIFLPCHNVQVTYAFFGV